ncbi:MAG: S-methyl-5'-thioadenosine phosphorylase [Rhodospirillaceae bacterium]|nr:MAG: S-methyl-5'-thioadenosine phosphorylase [Rhodospirillaceae bacterium]
MGKAGAARAGALGIIGGSGLYEIEGLQNTRWERVSSPFGEPSDEFFFGELDGRSLVFLPRHGRGHRIAPGDINYRANIDAMKRAGVTEILSLSAVGSLREELAPGSFVIVDQFIDRTTREKSFFGTGLVAHVAMARPVCARLGRAVAATCRSNGIPHVEGGTYLVMEGPHFSTLAESKFYRAAGLDVIGMTNMPEAALAREAEICYASVAMVTDYDCWHPDHDDVTVEAILKILFANGDKARELVCQIVPLVDGNGACPEGCNRALDNAIVTAEDVRDPDLMKKLDAVAGRVLKP